MVIRFSVPYYPWPCAETFYCHCFLKQKNHWQIQKRRIVSPRCRYAKEFKLFFKPQCGEEVGNYFFFIPVWRFCISKNGVRPNWHRSGYAWYATSRGLALFGFLKLSKHQNVIIMRNGYSSILSQSVQTKFIRNFSGFQFFDYRIYVFSIYGRIIWNAKPVKIIVFVFYQKAKNKTKHEKNSGWKSKTNKKYKFSQTNLSNSGQKESKLFWCVFTTVISSSKFIFSFVFLAFSCDFDDFALHFLLHIAFKRILNAF